MATSAEKRRLLYILSDELYGPKLARLRGEDERKVLELISENKGGEAREAILEADERRRAKRRRGSNREAREAAAVANILRQFGKKARADRVRRNVSLMTPKDLDFAADASADELRMRARRKASKIDPEDGKSINPFWYH